MNILALEVGTAMVSAAVMDVATGQPCGAIADAYYPPREPASGAAEVMPQDLWEAVTSVARSAARKSGVGGKTASEIAGIGLTTFAPGMVLLDKADQPLGSIWMPGDIRARPAARQVWAHVGAEFHAAIGSRPLPSMSAITYRQLIIDDPYVSHRAATYLHVNGWLAFQMSGAKAFDPGQASATGLLTLTEPTWSPRWCDYFEIDRAWLPPIIDGGATVGTVRTAVAAELGVPAGIPVRLGADFLGSALFAAGMKSGDVLHQVGATQTLAALTDQPEAGPRRGARRLGIGSRYLHVTNNPIGGSAVAWLHALCFRDKALDDFLNVTMPQALQRETRVTFDPPFLDGDILENEACRAAFRDLESSTDRLDLLAALIKAMRQRHAQAMADLEQREPLRRIFLLDTAVQVPRQLVTDDQEEPMVRGGCVGGGATLVRRLLPGYDSDRVTILENAPLRGVARLFA